MQKESWIQLCDNSTARWLKIFHIYRKGRQRCGSVGYIFLGTIRKARPVSVKKLTYLNLRKSQKVQGQIIRLRRWVGRRDGSQLRCEDNSGLLIRARLTLRGMHISGPIVREAGRHKLIIRSVEII